MKPCARSKSSRGAHRPNVYRPRLEGLEKREVPSASANLAGDGVWIRFDDGQLWEHTSAGTHFIQSNVASVSSGLDSSGAEAAFIRTSDNRLYEYSANIGTVLIDTNVASMSGSQNYADTVFIQYQNGFVYEHQGVGLEGHFRRIDFNAQAISTGIDGFGEASVFIRYYNNQLWEWSAHNGFKFIDTNVQSMSASQVTPDTTFIVYFNSYLYEHSGLARLPGFRFIASNVSSVSAGKTREAIKGSLQFEASAFIVYHTSQVYEWLPAFNTFDPIDGNAVAVSASQNGLDTCFIIYTNTAMFEHTGQSSQSGFSLISTNVTV